MKKILVMMSAIFILTACGSKLPDPNMPLPTEPPNPELMEPSSAPQ